MKELLIVRHAKSSWADEGLDDHERPLNKRGRHDAPLMGRRLAGRGLVPDRVLSSDAVRARETTAAIATGLALDGACIEYARDLYEAAPADWLARLHTLDDKLGRVMLVGHNPTLQALAEQLVDLRVDKFPTAAVVHAALDVERWADAAPGCGRCLDFDYPKRGD